MPASAGPEVARTLSVDDLEEATRELQTHDRDAYLGSSRSQPACGRELERLSTEIARRAAAVDPELAGAKAEVRRSPGRCIVQLGPVALTASWVRSRTDTVSEGRLLIVEWKGTVARGPQLSFERTPARPLGPPATPVREDVLLADATSEKDWRWRCETDASGEQALPTVDLAARCVDRLVAQLEAARI
ncbi:MAG TPA: hypothetical protein VEA99_06925 [Gemmatimonadaceae bacterium]|nr:hypothetical protein [Gemmatimonadaceae bacterium]